MNPPVIIPTIFSPFPEIIAGMSTRNGGISPPPLGMNTSMNVGDTVENVYANRALFYGALNIPVSRLAVTKQVHGTTIAKVTGPGTYDATDGFITNVPNLFLSISTADCVPILLYDPKGKTVAAIHSGWRGTREKILSDAIRLMKNDYGADPSAIRAWIGPAAGGCCYEVGEEVAAQFDARYLIRQEGRKPRLDLKARLHDLLLESGLRQEYIEVSPECTIDNAAVFHSYRRDGNRSGRMAAVIGIRSPV